MTKTLPLSVPEAIRVRRTTKKFKPDPDIAIARLLPVGCGESAYTHAGRLPEEITVFRNRLTPA